MSYDDDDNDDDSRTLESERKCWNKQPVTWRSVGLGWLAERRDPYQAGVSSKCLTGGGWGYWRCAMGCCCCCLDDTLTGWRVPVCRILGVQPGSCKSVIVGTSLQDGLCGSVCHVVLPPDSPATTTRHHSYHKPNFAQLANYLQRVQHAELLKPQIQA